MSCSCYPPDGPITSLADTLQPPQKYLEVFQVRALLFQCLNKDALHPIGDNEAPRPGLAKHLIQCKLNNRVLRIAFLGIT